jgi:hypothetical protein
MATFKYGEVSIMKLLSQNPSKTTKPGTIWPGFVLSKCFLIINNVSLNIRA